MTTNSKSWFTYHGLNIPNGWAGIPPHLLPPIDFRKVFVNKKASAFVRATCTSCGRSIEQAVELWQSTFNAPDCCPHCKNQRTTWNVTIFQSGLL